MTDPWQPEDPDDLPDPRALLAYWAAANESPGGQQRLVADTWRLWRLARDLAGALETQLNDRGGQRLMTGTVVVDAHDLHRLLLEFRAQLERGDRPAGGFRGGWHHGVDYDRSFEQLADILDAHLTARGTGPDPRTRCKHGTPVYTWPDSPTSVTWVCVRAGSVDGHAGPRQQHLAGVPAQPVHSYRALCGFRFSDEDITRHPRARYPRCGVCEREASLRGLTTVAGQAEEAQP